MLCYLLNFLVKEFSSKLTLEKVPNKIYWKALSYTQSRPEFLDLFQAERRFRHVFNRPAEL